ncbi:MAG TPA: hypothetical protein VH374_17905 [Polyangia bacterium]|nr:hypothetical protein [Polyangia bacterium]
MVDFSSRTVASEIGSIDASDDSGDSDGADDSVTEPAVSDGGVDSAAEAAPDDDGNGSPDDGSPSEVDGPAPSCPGPDCPLALAAGHLQLWLRGDQGVSCDGGRVTRWTDLSGRHNDASPPAGQWGPICGASAGQLNGRDVIMFPRGTEPDAVAAEHLEVDFRTLAQSSLTIAVVEKRDDAPVTASWMIGTPLPFPTAIFCDDSASVNQTLGMVLGYLTPDHLIGSFWGDSCQGPGESVSPPPVSKPSTTIMIFQPSTGISLFINGKQGEGDGSGFIKEDGLGPLDTNTADAHPAAFMGRGLIGRGFEATESGVDSRYKGLIAEVIIYNAPMVTSDRKLLEAYLTDRWNTDQ